MAGGSIERYNTYSHKTRKSKNGIAPTPISFTNLKLLTFMKLRISSAKIRRKIDMCKCFLKKFKNIFKNLRLPVRQKFRNFVYSFKVFRWKIS